MNADKLHFVVIDDSRLDCFIAEKVIQNTGRSESVRTFSVAVDALDYIQTLSEDIKTIVLVDIQMPVMNGFDFLEQFEKRIPEEKRANFIINLLSSSINETDQIKAKAFSSVNRFMNKPLTKKSLETLLATV